MRKMNFPMYILLMCSACILAFPHLASADLYLKYRQHTDAFMVMGEEQPAKDVVRETWVAKNMIRNDEGQKTVIMRFDKKLIYFVSHEQKKYSALPLDIEKMAKQAIENDENISPQEKEQAKRIIDNMMEDIAKLNITVKDTGEKKKIGNWNCRKYIQTTNTAMGPSVTEIWATSDIDLDYELLNKTYASSLMILPSLKGSMNNISKEMRKIKGITVYSKSLTSAMDTQIKANQELIAYAEKKTPEGFYEPPKGYAKHEM